MPASPRRSATVVAVVLSAVAALLAAPAAAQASGQDFMGVDTDGVPQYRLAAGASPTPVRPTSTAYRADYAVPVDGRERVFRLYVPPGLDGRPAPLVIGLHGLYGDRRQIQGLMDWERLATAHRFVVLYPQGSGNSWNAGRCCGRAAREGVDDVRALAQLQRLAARIHPVDLRRRYVTGFSNGGMMALALACARPDLVAGVLVVAGGHVSPCRPTRPVPVLQVHGTADAVVPYAGASYSETLVTSLPSVGATQDLWRRANEPRSAPTRLVRIEGGGHVWPAAATSYDATARGWEFLRAQWSWCVPRWLSLRSRRGPACG